jgi:hypothetical protein
MDMDTTGGGQPHRALGTGYEDLFTRTVQNFTGADADKIEELFGPPRPNAEGVLVYGAAS